MIAPHFFLKLQDEKLAEHYHEILKHNVAFSNKSVAIFFIGLIAALALIVYFLLF